MTWSLMGTGGGYRLAHWLTMLFTKHCSLCHAGVRPPGAGIVRAFGRLYCCQAHADRHTQCLDTACHKFSRRHATHHGDNRLLPSAGADQPSARVSHTRCANATRDDRGVGHEP
jgi:hypothetical protein